MTMKMMMMTTFLVGWMVWVSCLTKKMKVRHHPRNDQQQQAVQRLPRRNLPRSMPMRHIIVGMSRMCIIVVPSK